MSIVMYFMLLIVHLYHFVTLVQLTLVY